MQKKSLPFFGKFILLIGCLFSLVYVSACLTPYLNPFHSWLLTMLALGFPFLLCGMLGWILICFIFLRKYSLYFFILLLLGFKNISAVFALNPFNKFTQEKKGSFRLLSWNVDNFLDSRLSNDTPGNPYRQMLSFLKQSNADVLCFQDCSNYIGKGYSNTFNIIKDSLGYRYQYFPIDFTYRASDLEEKYGTVIFSKFPITSFGKTKIAIEDPQEYLAYADVLINGKTIRFFNTHLRSMNIHTSTHQEKNSYLKTDTALMLHKSTFKVLKYFDRIHTQQSIIIKKVMDTTQLPFVFCADLNAVATSYTYHHLKNNLQDAFLQNGFGLGTTYDSLSPTLRIDVVLMNKLLKPVQHHTPHLHLSDHFPNIVDIAIP